MSDKMVSEVLLEQLYKWNVTDIYGYAGDTILNLFSQLKDSPIQLYTTKHEGTAGLMASAAAKATGELGVCVAHSGPGTANIINGIADAYSDRAPLLLITGQVETYNLGTNYKQFVKQIQLTEPLTVFSSIVSNPDSIVDLMVQAMTMSIVKGGVSHLVIPMDMWDKKTNAKPREYLTHLDQKIRPEEPLIQAAKSKIEAANKPIILYGRGVKEAQDELITLSQTIAAPLINTLPAAGLLDNNHHLVIGGLGHAGNQEADNLLKEADLIIILGATWWPMDYVPREPKIIQIDAIKENLGLVHPIDLGIVGDLKISLSLLVDNLSAKRNEEWVTKVEGIKINQRENLNRDRKEEDGLLAPQDIIEEISNQTEEDEIICLDSGDSVVWFGKYFNNKCKDVLLSGSWRTMGFALPASLAAKINFSDNLVTCIIGDGGLEMVLGELLTAARYNLAVRIIIINNGSLAMEKHKMISANLQVEEVNLTNPDFIQLAKACKVKGIQVTTKEELNQVLAETKKIDQPTVINIPTAAPIPEGTKL